MTDMLNRRGFLGGITAVGMASLGGCGGQFSIGGNRTISDTASYNGVEVTPDKYLLADSATRVYSRNQRNITSPDGATYLFTHIAVSHEGDSAEEFPNNRYQDNIHLFYDGERVTESIRSEAAESYLIQERRLTTYSHAIQKAGLTGEVYPGESVEGWLFHELAANFDPSKLELRIVWNQQMLGDEGETTHKWEYSSDAEISIQDIEAEERTISL